jgi:hypothetical protein
VQKLYTQKFAALADKKNQMQRAQIIEKFAVTLHNEKLVFVKLFLFSNITDKKNLLRAKNSLANSIYYYFLRLIRHPSLSNVYTLLFARL